VFQDLPAFFKKMDLPELLRDILIEIFLLEFILREAEGWE